MIGTQLFEGTDIHFTAIDPEKDAVLESAWLHDLHFADLQRQSTFRHLSIFEARKHFENLQKEAEEKGSTFHFAIRVKSDERLIGFVHFPWVAWSNGSAFMRLVIAEPDDLSRYGQAALDMLLIYVFSELNLYRATVILPEYNRAMVDLYERAGFQLEVRMRDFYYRSGRLWDQFVYGIVADEWQKKQPEVQQ
jgi:RimJ/RimL family protein N-acetyltransferase